MHTVAGRILLGMGAGAFLGALLQGRSDALLYWLIEPVGTIWLNLLLVMMLPLASSALVLGILGLEPGQLARMGGRIVALTLLLTSSAVAVGLLLVSTVRPGLGVDAAALPAGTAPAPSSADPVALFVEQFPSNVVAAAAGKNLLPVLVFAVLFGLALRSTKTDGAARVAELIQGTFDVSSRGIAMVLFLGPIGVAALTFRMAAKGGFAALLPVGWFATTVILGLAIQMFLVYPVVLRAIGGRSTVAFFRDARAAMTMAFSTASSAATLPTALDVAEHRLGIPPETARFVLTIGATGNQNGTALFEGVAVLFLAQMYSVDLTIAQQAGVVGVAILGGIGTAGVPGGALPVITALSVAVGVPAEAVGAIVGVDRLLDMCRTTANVTGDLVIAACVAGSAKGPSGRIAEAAST